MDITAVFTHNSNIKTFFNPSHLTQTQPESRHVCSHSTAQQLSCLFTPSSLLTVKTQEKTLKHTKINNADVDFGKARIDFHRYEFPNQ